MNVKNFRNLNQNTDVHNLGLLDSTEESNYENAKQKYETMAKDLNYLNKDGKERWSGTIKNAKGGLKFDLGNGEQYDVVKDGDPYDVGIKIMKGNSTRHDKFHFQPELSDYKNKSC